MYLITDRIFRSRAGPDLVFLRIEIRLSPFICDVVNHVCSRFATLRTDRPLSSSACARDPRVWAEAYYRELETCSGLPDTRCIYICTVYLFLLQIRIFSLSQYKRFPKIHRDTKVILTRDKCVATFDIYNTKIQ